ncbi:MAG: ion transporter [Fusobacterium sp.]|nr:ion transporter [Fusobacterium sp.]
MKEKLQAFIESKSVSNFILAVIIINSIILGMLTYPALCEKFGYVLQPLCDICVLIFTVEIFIKLYVYNGSFFKDGWNNFDFMLVAISWIPTAGVFSSFRAFRVLRALRALRLVTKLEKLRIIVQAIIESIPNVGWASVLLLLLFYIFSIMGTTMFSEAFPEFFGSIGKSMYSLFQIMTLESWSMGIARPVIAEFPFAWMYFISFILVSSFIVMNVIVGIVVNAISELSAQAKQDKLSDASDLNIEIEKLKNQLKIVESLLEKDLIKK